VQSEVNFLGRLSHPNLVRLLGYCGEDRELLLVYEFMSKGSLETISSGVSTYRPLPLAFYFSARFDSPSLVLPNFRKVDKNAEL